MQEIKTECPTVKCGDIYKKNWQLLPDPECIISEISKEINQVIFENLRQVLFKCFKIEFIDFDSIDANHVNADQLLYGGDFDFAVYNGLIARSSLKELLTWDDIKRTGISIEQHHTRAIADFGFTDNTGNNSLSLVYKIKIGDDVVSEIHF